MPRARELDRAVGRLLLVTLAEVRREDAALRRHRLREVCDSYMRMPSETTASVASPTDGGCRSKVSALGRGARRWGGRQGGVRHERWCHDRAAVSGSHGGYLVAVDLGEVVGHHQ